MAMTIDELIAKLRHIASDEDTDNEQAHQEADALLLTFINNDDVRAAFHAIDKWYA